MKKIAGFGTALALAASVGTLGSIGVARSAKLASAVEVVKSSEKFDYQRLGARSFAVKTRSGQSKAGSNSGFIVLEKCVAVIDSHASPEYEKEVAKEIENITGKPVCLVILTHFHEDHAGGAAFYLGGKVRFVADKRSIQPTEELLPALKGKIQAASSYKGLKSEGIELLSVGPAHSAGDLLVYDRKDRILFSGDMVVNGYVGYLAEADFKRWISTLEKTRKLKISTVVPGHGAIGTLSILSGYLTYLKDFVSSARQHFIKTKSPTGYELPEKYRDLGAQFYLKDNVQHAYDLWLEKKL